MRALSTALHYACGRVSTKLKDRPYPVAAGNCKRAPTRVISAAYSLNARTVTWLPDIFRILSHRSDNDKEILILNALNATNNSSGIGSYMVEVFQRDPCEY